MRFFFLHFVLLWEYLFMFLSKKRERERDVVVDVDDLYDNIVCVNRMHIRITYPTYL